MFSTFKLKLLLALYIFIIISIPTGAYLVSQRQTIKSSASEEKNKTVAKSSPKPTSQTSSKQTLLDLAKKNLATPSATPSPSPEASSPTIATSFGPTIFVKVKLEGRNSNQSTKLFVGIIEGTLSSNPKYLLNFSVNLPSSGEYSGLSLAGLTVGSTYTALVKGQAQLATAVSFTMSPTETKLNSGSAVSLTSGDLNDDNTINSTDLGIMKSALGATSSSRNWYEIADINKDGVINIIDYSILYKNMGKSGDSGVWVSPIPSATSSAQLKENLPVGSPDSPQGYWIWVPK